jgi:hypothetical protein
MPEWLQPLKNLSSIPGNTRSGLHGLAALMIWTTHIYSSVTVGDANTTYYRAYQKILVEMAKPYTDTWLTLNSITEPMKCTRAKYLPHRPANNSQEPATLQSL